MLALALIIGSCGNEEEPLYGYSEGRFRLLSMPMSGQLQDVSVRDGDRVEAGTVLAALDTTVVAAQLEEAKARVASARSRLADARAGGRTQEIKAAEDRLARAKASARNAQQSHARAKALFNEGIAPKSRLDGAEAALRETQASAAEAAQQLALTALPARSDQIKALEADVHAAEAALEGQTHRLAQMELKAPTSGLIERVLRDVGEPAGPSAPVIRFLPEGERKAVLFVSSMKRPSLSLGQRLSIECDGCKTTYSATIDRLSSEAEFTSPMIFSDVARDRLTYRLEAGFLGDAPPSGTPIWAKVN
jgi:HlyD family secretion protein